MRACLRPRGLRLSLKTFHTLCLMLAIGGAGCAHMAPVLYAPQQPDGWSSQPVVVSCRFTPDAKLDSVTRIPVGDEGYYLYLLTKAAAWDYRTMRSYLVTHARQPWGHGWLMLEGPENRLEGGLNGNFGRDKPKYGDGVSQKFRDGDPNPISYLWETMSDGEFENGNGNRTPTFVWQMPITRQQYQLIYKHVLEWKYDRIGVQTNNCTDFVTEAAALAGLNLIHRVRLTIPAEIKILGRTWRMWTDPQYRVLEYSTADLLEVDLRHLARFGIGRDVTAWYLASNLAAPKSMDRGSAGVGSDARAEDGR